MRTAGFSSTFGTSGTIFFSLRGALGSILPEKTQEIKSSLFLIILGSSLITSLALIGLMINVSSSSISISLDFCTVF
ncbi:TPA: hypothetical protein DIC40_03090 [Patescibacteria group bacterium]|nr:hypothetical protein [Candidatus Gracilibacteria bacterium]